MAAVLLVVRVIVAELFPGSVSTALYRTTGLTYLNVEFRGSAVPVPSEADAPLLVALAVELLTAVDVEVVLFDAVFEEPLPPEIEKRPL